MSIGLMARRELQVPFPTLGAGAVALDRVCWRSGRTVVLDEVTFSAAAGTIVGIVGRNGAGKTTLLRCVLGLVRPTTGRITVCGRQPDAADASFCRHVGYLPSGTRSFHLRLSGRENLRFFGRLLGLRGDRLQECVGVALTEVDLTGVADRAVGGYSQGMQRRLGVARMLLSDAPVLALDEATHDLDAVAAAGVRRAVNERARRGATVLWVSQRLDELPGFVDRILVVDGGRVLYDGVADDLLRRHPPRRFDVVLLEPPTHRHVGALGGCCTHVSVRRRHELVIALRDGVTLGTALGTLQTAGATVVSCAPCTSPLQATLERLDGGRG